MAEGSSRMTEGMLSLSWNNHSAAFTQTLATLREKEIYTDVTLACGGKFYPVHKLVLSTCSDYFLQMFERTSCKHPIIILKDVQCREMEALLSYMYAGIVCVPQSDLPQLIMVAEALQIKGLAVPDETMCANKRLSHTWSPTDDRISPHAKRLRQGDNGAGIIYHRYPDGPKTQTLTGIPSFSGTVPQTVNSPTIPSAGKHLQHSIRPTYTTVRYAPYPREPEKQQTSSKQIETISMKEFLGMFKNNKTSKQGETKSLTTHNTSGQGIATSQNEVDNSYSELDKEIIPETVLKVEVEEGTEPVQVQDLGESSFHEKDTVHGQMQTRPESQKTDMLKTTEPTIKVEPGAENESLLEVTNFSAKSHFGGNHTSSSELPSTAKIKRLDVPSVASCHKDARESTPPRSCAADVSSSFGEGEDSSHPLDLSDTQKNLHQAISEDEMPRTISTLSDNKVVKYSCPYCTFKTTHKAPLTKHLRTHSLENPFSCPYCPFRAPIHLGLKEHMNTHKNTGGMEGGH